MSATRAKRWLWCLLGVFLGYVVFRGAHRGNDFKYPYNVARVVWREGRLDVASQPRYPVSFHVLLAPLAGLPIGAAAAVWAVLSIAAVAALPQVLGRLTGIPPRRQVPAWLVAIPFIADAIVLGQADPINLFLVSAGLLAVKEGRAVVGTGLVGLAGAIKFLPIVFWTTIVARCRRPGVFAGMALTAVVGFGAIAGAVGPEGAAAGIREQLAWIRDHEKPWHLAARGTDLRPNNESLPIVLARTFGDLGPNLPPDGVRLARLPLDAVWMAWFVILALLALAWLASVRPASRLAPGRGWLAMFALTAILMLACTPICWHHYFLWTLPAALFLSRHRRWLLAAAALSLAGTASQAARGLGCHMVMALVFFVAVAREVWCPALPPDGSTETAPPGPGGAGSRDS